MKRSFLLIVLSAVFGTTLGQGTEALIKSGMKSLEAKKYDAAMQSFNAAIGADQDLAKKQLAKYETYEVALAADTSLEGNGVPMITGDRSLALPYYGMAKANAGKKDLETALYNANMALRLDRDFADAYYLRALLKAELDGDLAACMDYAIAANKGHEKAKSLYESKFCWEASVKYYRAARTKFDLKKYDIVLNKLDTALRVDPNAHEAYFTRGAVYFDQGKLIEAYREFSKAIALDTMKAEYIFNRGLLLSALDEHEKAFADYSKALELNSNYLEAYLARAKNCLQMKRYNSADFDYTSAIRLSPEDGELYFLRAKVREALPKYDEEQSCADYKKAYSLDYLEAQEKSDYCHLHPVQRRKLKEKEAKGKGKK